MELIIPQIEVNCQVYALSGAKVEKGEIVEVAVFNQDMSEVLTFKKGEFRILTPMCPVKGTIGLDSLVKIIK
jgi:F420-dependent methylenetetrahydromethanopterin dehydrogenase